MFHHSFEHMPDPLEKLIMTRCLLAENGKCLIRIPVIGWAWKRYGTNWVQLDALRHFFLHTEKSMDVLAGEAGLEIERIEYDSTEMQFWGSELYVRGVAFNSIGTDRWQDLFSRKQIRDFRKKAEQLNKERRAIKLFFISGPFRRNRSLNDMTSVLVTRHCIPPTSVASVKT